MMVFVQSFLMHFHFFAEADDDHQSHAHAHTLDSTYADHFSEEHHDEVRTDILGTLAKYSLPLDLYVSALLILVLSLAFDSYYWARFREIRPQQKLLYFQPPLRAPPLNPLQFI